MFLPEGPLWVQAFSMLALGLVMAFNPCMLAMGPAAAAYLGRSPYQGMMAGSRLGLTFITGYALSLALLGTILTSLGQLTVDFAFWWPYLLAGIYWALGLYFLRHGLRWSPPVKVSAFYCHPYRWRLPRGRALGALLGGLAIGFVPSPCATPMVIAVSAYFLPGQQYGQAAWTLFFFGLGHGLPLFLSAFLTTSLKAGAWARLINPLLGFILVGLGFYFLWQGPELFVSQ